MRAVVVTDFATEPVLADLPVPEPGPGQLLVRLHAAAVNPFDWKVADGALKSAAPHAFPLVLGSDGAGVVAKAGPGVTRFQPGDRVYGQFMLLEQGQGSYAEYAIADQDGKIAPIPDNLPYALAAALPTATVTAYQAVETAKLDDRHTVLINGAGGGVGQSAIQFASQTGARVLATGTPATAGYLTDLGAHTVIDFTDKPTHDQVAGLHPDGIDAVLDLVTQAGEDISPMARLLRPGGVLISTNYAADPDALAARDVLAVNLGNQPTPEVLATIARLAATGALRVRIAAEVPLDQAPAAIAHARNGHANGKTIIVP